MPTNPIAMFLILGVLGLSRPADAAERTWRFEARLDNRPIGEHTFRVSQSGDDIVVDSRASFDVRVLGFSLYTYEHHATERWKGGCLASLESHTNDNGKMEHVAGSLTADGFVVARNGTEKALSACTMTFAYWNPEMRRQKALLNPQTGEYLDVELGAVEPATMGEEARRIDANRVVLRGKDLEIALWYATADDRWLALDSRTAGGRLLTYRLQEPLRTEESP